ncbi:MAG: hypothetical protein CXT64_04360 [Methanobacteriota archaeon]|nr:MAG: hypothetical protein CXT64_04360 [Euryarchaeota archaeon]
MGRISTFFKSIFRWIPLLLGGAAAVIRRLPEKSRKEITGDWGAGIEKAWDTTKIGAEEFGETSAILAQIVLGRKVSRANKKKAKNSLADLSLVVPPLRVFMIPGSQILLGLVAFVTPWRLIPDEWIPIDALRSVRENNHSHSLEEESSKVLDQIGEDVD